MDGVLVLDTIVNTNFGWNFFTIGFLIFFGLFVIMGILGLVWEHISWNGVPNFIVIFWTIAFGGTLIFGLLAVCFGCTETITQYRVMIDDTVKMTEFFQHYTIVEQEGLTYIVEFIP